MAKSRYASPHATEEEHQDFLEKYASNSKPMTLPDAGNRRNVIEHSLDETHDTLRFLERQLRR